MVHSTTMGRPSSAFLSQFKNHALSALLFETGEQAQFGFQQSCVWPKTFEDVGVNLEAIAEHIDPPMLVDTYRNMFGSLLSLQFLSKTKVLRTCVWRRNQLNLSVLLPCMEGFRRVESISAGIWRFWIVLF